VKDIGITYTRELRWKLLPDGKGYRLRFGMDKAEYSIVDLIELIKTAMAEFVNTMTSVFNFYINQLRSSGIKITFDKTSSTINIKLF